MEFRCIPQDLASALGTWAGDTLVVGLFASDDSNREDPRRQGLANLFGRELLLRLEHREPASLNDPPRQQLLQELLERDLASTVEAQLERLSQQFETLVESPANG